MSHDFQSALRRRRTGRLAWPLMAGLMLGGLGALPAHEQLAALVQHHAHLVVGRRYIDLSLDLTFFELSSARERRLMDADGNGRITRAETDAYLKKLSSAWAQQLKLRVGGHELDLVPLYDPELNLLGNDAAGDPARHRLRLWFFTSTPPSVRPGDDIVVEDRLWPQAGALGTFEAEGRDGSVLEAGPAGDAGFAPAPPGEPRLFRARCLKPPATQPPKP